MFAELKSRLAAGAFVATVMAAASAHAVPSTANIGGVVVPLGITPGGFSMISETITENIVAAIGDTARGTGRVNVIEAVGAPNPADNVVTWVNGQNGKTLLLAFDGFVADSATPPPGGLTFMGGTVGLYLFDTATAPAFDGNGSAAASLAAVMSGTPWLTLTAVAQDAAGHTLIVDFNAGTTFSNFTAAGGTLFLDVTGGLAADFFDTCTFVNAFDPNGCSDILFTQTSNAVQSPSDFNNPQGIHTSGQGQAKVNLAIDIPEPSTLLVLGAGLLGLGLRRRFAQA